MGFKYDIKVYERRMKKVIFIFIFCMFGLIHCSCIFRTMDNLPTGDFIESSYSPEGNYRIDSYLCSGNATTAFSVRCAVVEIETDKSRNIYWEYRKEEANIEWINETTVEINGKEINILTDSYDWRNE